MCRPNRRGVRSPNVWAAPAPIVCRKTARVPVETNSAILDPRSATGDTRADQPSPSGKDNPLIVAEPPLRPTAIPVAEIMLYENERLYERYAVDHGTSLDGARERFVALKQFLTVCAVKPGIKVASDEIDRMWHTFLLFTRDYREFCNDKLGRFVEHEPFEEARPEYYEITRDFAADMFGDLNDTYWPPQGKADCTSGCGD